MTAATNPSADVEPMLTVAEFAEATQVHERTIRRHLSAGTLPHEKRRGHRGHPRIYIPRSAVEPFKRAEDIPAPGTMSTDPERDSDIEPRSGKPES